MILRLDERQHFTLDKLRILTRHGVVFQPAFAALRIASAIADGDGYHRRHASLGDQVIESRKQRPVRSIGADDEGRDGAWHILFGDVNSNVASVGSGVAGGNDEFGGIRGIECAKCIGLARNAGKDLAIRRTDGELINRSLRHAFLRGHLRRGVVRGPENEVAIGICGGIDAIRQIFSLDISGRAGIARGRSRARRVWRRLRGLRRLSRSLSYRGPKCRYHARHTSNAQKTIHLGPPFNSVVCIMTQPRGLRLIPGQAPINNENLFGNIPPMAAEAENSRTWDWPSWRRCVEPG